LDDPLCGDIERLRWEPRGVGLDWGPWDVGEANEPTPRPNPSNGNTSTHKYHQTPLEGKRVLNLTHGLSYLLKNPMIAPIMKPVAIGPTITTPST